ncbi:MAG: hydroxymethylbilane synthase [Blastocatellia bacterium]|nr:hydroxymethylbilane synthase [Blastocatellia bacterium]MCS7157475.1 hydroxymethylbilane synthase [Blastocatellia bacterium]MCX7752648.1 hydroxymethylbilane synthase [Blastocatellia bacterium]MDW8168379.1 hydroxymethylbilane synthase [Acidobacteriota bacterium]MDW8255575.1 hydroxymethylbilane synthase [Acidobacteriota bacterium]
MTRSSFIIGSRGSALALRQAEIVRARLVAHYPHLAFSLRIIRTSGDRITDRPLTAFGGKGLFIKELEEALLAGEIDLAVHSLKDMPAEIPEGLHLAAILEREDPRDALVTRTREGTVRALREGAIVGTSSLRRLAQLRALRPDLDIRPLRGNVDTRLRKLDAGQYEAIVLAVAGLVRLGLEERIAERIPTEVMIPAIGQGAIVVETRVEDEGMNALLRPLDHPPTRAATTAERAFLQRLGGGCHVPIAAHAEPLPDDPSRLILRGMIASPDGARLLKDQVVGPLGEAVALGHQLAERLIAAGALALLHS